jgi:hypothetical protein
MSRHSQTQRRSPRPTGFLAAWDHLIGAAGLPTLPRRRGRKPRVPLTDLLPALTFHVMQSAGTLADHFFELFGQSLADRSWSDRRARLPWEIFADLLRRALRPRATRRHAEAFWRGWRLVALDGTQFSLTNTPQIAHGPIAKAKTRRGRAAFAKLTTNVLLEVGLHNPLAAAIGRGGESEWALALQLLAQLPTRALLLGDRLYGCAAFVTPALAACERVGSHLLIRARADVKARVITRLADGSRLIRVRVREPGRPMHIIGMLEVREIRVRVGRPGRRTQEVRLWTSLLDPQTAPALDLAQLYARRWEHELYYRELKRAVRKGDVLQSHTVETGAQEIAALVLVSALLATERARAATAQIPPLRVSFIKVLQVVQSMWLFFGVFEDLITERQKDQIVRRGDILMRRFVTAKRRSRSCPRAVRQPVTAWPRLRRTESIEGPLHFEVR